jgi:Na+(H+)/acetate symporter ActP
MSAPIPLKNPGIVSIPLSFIAIVVVSLLTQKSGKANQDADG